MLRWHPADGSAGFYDEQTGSWAFLYQIKVKIRNALRKP